MKSKKFLRALNEADDRFIEEARPKPRINQRLLYRVGLIAACLCLVVTGLNLWLFLPYNTSPPDVSRYKDSPYYAIIDGLNTLNHKPPRYKNNYESIVAKLKNDPPTNGNIHYSPTDDIATGNTGSSYIETTDNQATGVIEPDLIKRSDTHIYYLYGHTLYVYEIADENTAKVGQYEATVTDENLDYYFGVEIYLSEDCKTVTLVLPYSSNQTRKIDLLSLDVSDPANIREIKRITILGDYRSSRKINGNILLMSDFTAQNIDFDNESTFLPQFDIGNGMESVPVDAIWVPEVITSNRYKVFAKFSEDTLSFCGITALLSSSTDWNEVEYVSETHIYTTREYFGTKKDDLSTETEIFAISYTGETMTIDGHITVDGRLNNRYSMDEYNGMLRVVTSTNSTVNGRNANLYCISLSDFTVAGEVIGFAPRETVESVRFDGNYAYVCTAVVVEMTDPVFFFDLTDPQNITYKDTGVIDGYSSSLVDFGNGRLLGIGYGDTRQTLKIEIYEESENGVISVDAFELIALFSEDYKAYFIDRENQLIGIPIQNQEEKNPRERAQYILLHFDGYHLTPLLTVHTPKSGGYHWYTYTRGLLIDNHFYVFFDDECFVSRVEIPAQ